MRCEVKIHFLPSDRRHWSLFEELLSSDESDFRFGRESNSRVSAGSEER